MTLKVMLRSFIHNKITSNAYHSVGLIVSICALCVIALCVIALSGIAGNPEVKSQISPHPQNGVEDLKNIYQYILVYRRNNEGTYPPQMGDLSRDMVKRFKDYGYKDFGTALNSLFNPDTRFSEDPGMRAHPENNIPYLILNKRRDGSSIESPRPVGTRDALAYTGIYYHLNSSITNERKVQLNPMGVYLVLWSDGLVDQVPYDQMIYVRNSIGFTVAFPGQAGIPSDSIAYQEYWSKVNGMSVPPIGKPIAKGKDEPVPDNGGPESLVQVSRLMSAPDFYGFEREKIWQLLDPAQPEFSLAESQAVGNTLGLPTQVKKATLDELANFGAPAILFLSDDKRQVALAALSDKNAMVIDRGVTRIVPREVLEKRYSGEALIPQVALDKPATLRAENGLQQITVNDIKQEIPIPVVLKNSGTVPLNLQIEQPIPGCLKAQLSADTIAPAAQVTLTASIKWREVMKTTAQNVIIWVKSNDPARPRLPIAIRLALPKPPTTP